MRLKLGILTSCYCLLACSLVSGKTADVEAPKDDTLLVPKVRPTVAPLTRSTIKPTLTPLKPATPTKAMVMNIPPKSKVEEKKAGPISEEQSETGMNNLKQVTEPPNTVKNETMKTDLVSNAKPVQVTGFITKNGNIYEIEDKDGIGLIEGRQNQADEKMNVCNYGNIVIYSDVPCEEVTNIRVGEVVQTNLKDEKDQSEQIQSQNQQQQQQEQQLHPQQNPNNFEQESDDFEEVKPSRRRNGQKRKRNQQKNQIRKKPSRNRNRNRNGMKTSANRNQQRRRRPQTQRRRRKQQQNRHRLQNQRYSTQRRQHNNHNRIEQRRRKGNSGRKGGNINRNRRRNQRLQQARRRQQEYGRGRFDEDY